MKPDPQSPETIFGEAIDIAAADEREAYLDRACKNDPELRGAVEQLVVNHFRAGKFLDKPMAQFAATIDTPGETALGEKPGTQIGPYKLLQQIGEGGMGTVYMAEQTHPVQRKVAVKVIKAGMDSRQVIARFEAERQALAMMDHVNIARVLDAGATEAGRPYFVMELVHGVSIVKYCDDNHLTPRQRLELFVPVCQAIQHAHQKGIIHRDIKPSNVMITLYDGKPVPKVIDFGVAKATEQKLTERTLFTQYGTMVGTLEYTSPEQVEMSALGVDTRSDIFSLGVLLYELLTGSTPLSHKRVREAAYSEVLRMIREEEPPKPSTRLSDSGAALASISANRHMEPAKLSRLMRGELDWIVMRSLAKDRSRRYETANGFAADVQRYLADEPVLACPPSVWYRFHKLARRNRAAFVTVALVALALFAGIIGTTWQAIQATSERDRASAAEWTARKAQAMEAGLRMEAEKARNDADAEARRANVVLDVIVQMLSKANPYDELGKNEDYTVRQLLLDFSQALPQELDSQPAVKAEIHAILAKGFTNLDADRAAVHIREALRLRRSTVGEDHPAYAEILLTQATFVPMFEGQYLQSEQLCRQALSILRKHPKEVHLRLRAYRNLVAALNCQQKYVEVDEFAHEAIEFAGRNNVENDHWLACLLDNYARSKMDRGQLDAAESLCKEALRLNRALGPHRIDTAWCAGYLADIQSRQKKHAEAEEHFREAAEIFGHDREYDNVGNVYNRLRGAMEAQGKAAEFQNLVDNPLDVGAVVYWFHMATGNLLNGNLKEYQRICRLLVENCSNSAHPTALDYVASTCIVHPQALNDWAPAVLLARRLVSVDPELSWNWTRVGLLLFREGNVDEALKTLTHAENLPEMPEDKEFYRRSRTIVRWFYLALANHRAGNEAPARKWFVEAENALNLLYSEKGSERKPWFEDTRIHLANLRSESQQVFSPEGNQAKVSTENRAP
jgi:serine/threonine protein kinase/tetratricopeptide (TPR) repeat protein